MTQYCSIDAGDGNNNTYLRWGWPANTPPTWQAGDLPLAGEELSPHQPLTLLLFKEEWSACPTEVVHSLRVARRPKVRRRGGAYKGQILLRMV